MTKGDCENITVKSSEKFAVLIRQYVLINPQMSHQNISSAFVTKCRLDPLVICSLLKVQLIGLESK